MAFGAPPVDGLGSTGGFKLQVQDRAGAGFEALQGAVENVIRGGEAQPGLVGLFSSFSAKQPQLYVDIDRTKAKAHGVALDDVFDTLQVYLGSAYVNDFTRFGRNWQVNVQADAAFRLRPEDIGALEVRNAGRQDGSAGDAAHRCATPRVRPSSTTTTCIPSAEINRQHCARRQLGQAIALMETVAQRELPTGMGFEWTELTLQQILAGKTADVRVRLRRAPRLPGAGRRSTRAGRCRCAIILIVPMCLLAAITGVWAVGSTTTSSRRSVWSC